jgi:hypothetical protein
MDVKKRLSYFTDGDGVGAQYQRILAMLGFCKVHNFEYVHNVANIGHNYDQDPAWNIKWDQMFGLGSQSYNCDPNPNLVETKYNAPIIILRSVSEVEEATRASYNIQPVKLMFDIVDKNPD